MTGDEDDSKFSLTWSTQWTQTHEPSCFCSLSSSMHERSFSDWVTENKRKEEIVIIIIIVMYPVVKVEMIKKPQDLVCSNKNLLSVILCWLAQEQFLVAVVVKKPAKIPSQLLLWATSSIFFHSSFLWTKALFYFCLVWEREAHSRFSFICKVYTHSDDVCFAPLSYIRDAKGCTTRLLAGRTFCSPGSTLHWKKIKTTHKRIELEWFWLQHWLSKFHILRESILTFIIPLRVLI